MPKRILLAIFFSYAVLWGADCEIKGNKIACNEITTDNSLTANQSNMNLGDGTDRYGGSVNVKSGSLNITFTPIVERLNLSATLTITGGSVNINWDSKNNSKGAFYLQENSQLNIKNGSFKSDSIMNNSGGNNGIIIEGGTLESKMLTNNASGKIQLQNGSLKTTRLDNYGTLEISNGTSNISGDLQNNGEASISGGTNTITNLYNNKNISISNGTNTITAFINDGSATISNGVSNTITTLSNRGDLTISGGTANTITTLTNNKTLSISNGTNTIDTLQNFGTATISGGTNTIGTRFNNNGNLKLESGNLTLQKYNITSNKAEAILNNNGVISGAGGISGGTIYHNGKFENFSGKLSNLNFANYTTLNIGGANSNINGSQFNSLNNFSNSGYLNIESTLSANGFSNYNVARLKADTLTINGGGKIAISCNDSNTSCPCNGDKNKICEVALSSAQNSRYLYLEGGSIDSKISFSNTGLLDLSKGNFIVDSTKSLDNNGGVIKLHGSANITADINNKGTFSIEADSSGKVVGKVNNEGAIYMRGGSIEGDIANNGGSFNLSGGSINGNFSNKTTQVTATDPNCTPSATDSCKLTTNNQALLIISGDSKIDGVLTNAKADDIKYNPRIDIIGGNTTITTLNNQSQLTAYQGSLSATMLNNSGGNLTAYQGSKITANTFAWGNGSINYINGNVGDLEFNTINNITANSILNLDFKSESLIFNKEYKIIKTDSSPTGLDDLTIKSEIQDNLKDSNTILFTKNYNNGYFTITASMNDKNIESKSLDSILSTNALQSLQGTEHMLDSLRKIDNDEVLANVLSNPSKVATSLNASNYNVSKNNARGNEIQLANTLSTLNRLNKQTTPMLLSQTQNIIKPNYSFTKTKNPLIRLASSRDSLDDEYDKYVKDNFKEDSDELKPEAVELKYIQKLDYENSIYTSIFGIFGEFDNASTNSFGVISGYDTKLSDNIILGGNLSYAMMSGAHNLGVGGYGRAYLGNHEIDFSLNTNFSFNEMSNTFLDKEQVADIFSFGLNGNVNYGYLFNIYKQNYIKPFTGVNLYYALTPSYKEKGQYAREVSSLNTMQLSLELGLEYRVILKKLYYLYVQAKIEQFVLNHSNNLQISFIGDSTSFEIAKYGGYKNYAWVILGGDFSVIRDSLNVTANVAYKGAIIRSKINDKSISENYAIVNVGIKYLF